MASVALASHQFPLELPPPLAGTGVIGHAERAMVDRFLTALHGSDGRRHQQVRQLADGALAAREQVAGHLVRGLLLTGGDLLRGAAQARRPRSTIAQQEGAAAARHAPEAMRLHASAGGPTGRPIYIAIDDNPTREQYTRQIRPYLQAFSKTLELAGYQTGIYGNYNTIEWALGDGIGTYFWMHDWGSGGRIHPRTTIHQPAKRTARVCAAAGAHRNVPMRQGADLPFVGCRRVLAQE